jgi:outer membrane protein TolC
MEGQVMEKVILDKQHSGRRQADPVRSAMTVVGLALALAWAPAGWSTPAPAAAVADVEAVPSAEPSAAPSAAAPAVAAPASPGAAALTLAGFVRQVLQVNSAVLGQRLNQQISEQEIARANAIFEPVAKFSASRGGVRQKNTAEEDLVRQSLGIYERRNSEIEAGLSVLAPTGATVEARVGMDVVRSNLQQVRDLPKEYQSLYDFAVTQPLARDRGSEVTRARVRMAELDAQAAAHGSREVTTAVVSDSIAAYLELTLAQQRDRLWADGVAMAARLLQEAKALQAQGRLSESAVQDVANSLLRYQVGANESRQRTLEAMNKLRTLSMTAAVDQRTELVAVEPLPEVHVPDAAFDPSMARALELRPDYLSRKLNLEREGVRIVYAQNQTLPRVDLMASYGINGLDYNGHDALASLRHTDYPKWTLGLQASIPLDGNRRASAELQAARLSKEKALLEFKAVETAIANDIDNSLVAMNNSHQRWEMYRQVLASETRQLEDEYRLLAAGRNDMRNVLAREEVMIRTRTALLEQALAFAKAKVAHAVAQGSLLEAFIDVPAAGARP